MRLLPVLAVLVAVVGCNLVCAIRVPTEAVHSRSVQQTQLSANECHCVHPALIAVPAACGPLVLLGIIYAAYIVLARGKALGRDTSARCPLCQHAGDMRPAGGRNEVVKIQLAECSAQDPDVPSTHKLCAHHPHALLPQSPAAPHSESHNTLLKTVPDSDLLSLMTLPSGPVKEITRARQSILACTDSVTDFEDMQQLALLGRGTYGRVYKATWKGVCVAVKTMTLKEHHKTEQMAIMETAISSSLSHPNIVQTYAYCVSFSPQASVVHDKLRYSCPGNAAYRSQDPHSSLLPDPLMSPQAAAAHTQDQPSAAPSSACLSPGGQSGAEGSMTDARESQTRTSAQQDLRRVAIRHTQDRVSGASRDAKQTPCDLLTDTESQGTSTHGQRAAISRSKTTDMDLTGHTRASTDYSSRLKKPTCTRGVVGTSTWGRLPDDNTHGLGICAGAPKPSTDRHRGKRASAPDGLYVNACTRAARRVSLGCGDDTPTATDLDHTTHSQHSAAGLGTGHNTVAESPHPKSARLTGVLGRIGKLIRKSGGITTDTRAQRMSRRMSLVQAIDVSSTHITGLTNIQQAAPHGDMPVRVIESQVAKSLGAMTQCEGGAQVGSVWGAGSYEARPLPSLVCQSWELQLVQEYCEAGSLRDLLDKGGFVDVCGSVDVRALVETLLDIARAMEYLHTLNIVHADLKPRNVLLKANPLSSRGFLAKVADFGLSVRLSADRGTVQVFQGTLSHMAPEVLLQGQLGKPADVYAFGMLIWECYTGARAYPGMGKRALIDALTRHGLRPSFPPSAPSDLVTLATQCWSAAPAARPTFTEIMTILSGMGQGVEPAPAPSDIPLSPFIAAHTVTDVRPPSPPPPLPPQSQLSPLPTLTSEQRRRVRAAESSPCLLTQTRSRGPSRTASNLSRGCVVRRDESSGALSPVRTPSYNHHIMHPTVSVSAPMNLIITGCSVAHSGSEQPGHIHVAASQHQEQAYLERDAHSQILGSVHSERVSQRVATRSSMGRALQLLQPDMTAAAAVGMTSVGAQLHPAPDSLNMVASLIKLQGSNVEPAPSSGQLAPAASSLVFPTQLSPFATPQLPTTHAAPTLPDTSSRLFVTPNTQVIDNEEQLHMGYLQTDRRTSTCQRVASNGGMSARRVTGDMRLVAAAVMAGQTDTLDVQQQQQQEQQRPVIDLSECDRVSTASVGQSTDERVSRATSTPRSPMLHAMGLAGVVQASSAYARFAIEQSAAASPSSAHTGTPGRERTRVMFDMGPDDEYMHDIHNMPQQQQPRLGALGSAKSSIYLEVSTSTSSSGEEQEDEEPSW